MTIASPEGRHRSPVQLGPGDLARVVTSSTWRRRSSVPLADSAWRFATRRQPSAAMECRASRRSIKRSPQPDNILLAVRPRNQEEWPLAYCQSHLYVEYLIKNYGIESVGPMPNAFRDGLDTGAAQKVLRSTRTPSRRDIGVGLEVVKSIPSAGRRRRKADDAGGAREPTRRTRTTSMYARLADQYSRRAWRWPQTRRKVLDKKLATRLRPSSRHGSYRWPATTTRPTGDRSGRTANPTTKLMLARADGRSKDWTGRRNGPNAPEAGHDVLIASLLVEIIRMRRN